jgi:hypothetical protein
VKIKHKFVQYIPDEIENNTLYISIDFGTAVHKCMCGCGNEVVTPLSPTDWEMIYNGETVSLYPSIGNLGFKCESHYWITHGKVKFVEKWSSTKIRANRERDKR